MNAGPVWRTRGVAELGAVALQDKLGRGELTAVDVAEAAIARIAEREPAVHAFAWHDPEHMRGEAKAALAAHRSGRPVGPLNGIPVAVKDIIDTAGIPTESGTPLDAGRRPRKDATVVARLKAAGAVIAGKSVTTEFAFMAPGPTRNPFDASRTPGGSSSGSAAAVAAGMVPLAVGTQTNGSVIRPASYCGIVGFKPSFGLIPRTGILAGSRPLDTVGAFGRSVEDVALLCDVMAGYDGVDPDVGTNPPPRLLEIARQNPPAPPTLLFVRTPVWDRAEPETRAGLEELAGALGKQCHSFELPPAFAAAFPLHRAMMTTGMARGLGARFDKDGAAMSAPLRAAIEEGRAVKALDYLKAEDARDALNAALEDTFDRFDAILTPAVPGEAPTAETTGDPIFCTIWSFCGVPAITLPLLEGPNGLPVGVQLVGRQGQDGRLLRTARWLMNYVTNVA